VFFLLAEMRYPYRPRRQKVSRRCRSPGSAHAHIGYFLNNFLRLLREPCGLEYSVQLRPGHISDERKLYSFRPQDLGIRARQKFIDRATSLGAPEAVLRALDEQFDVASVLHIGSDEGAEFPHKVYLEFGQRAMGGSADPVFIAYKWSSRPFCKGVITLYRSIGEVEPSGFASTWSRYYDQKQAAGEMALMVDLMGRIALARPGLSFRGLAVTEEEQPRHSLDINLYPAQLRLGDIGPWLEDARATYRIAPSRWRWLDAPEKRLGHIAGGMDRRGNPFLSIYFGIEEYWPEND